MSAAPMDPERRRRIAARRDAGRTDPRSEPDPRVRGDVVPRLRELGVAFRPAPFGIWTPPWLTVSGSGVLWHASPPADVMETYRHPDYWRYPPLPGEDEADRARRADQVADMLWLVAEGQDHVTFGYDSQATGVVIAVADALPVLETLLPERVKVWIWGLPNYWLIESDESTFTLLSLPPEPDREDIHRRHLREEAYAAPLASVVAADGGALRLVSRRDAAPPHLRRPLALPDWKTREKSLKALVERGDVEGLADEVRAWLEARAPGDAPLLIDLRHEDAPLIEIAAATLLSSFAGVAAQLHHVDETPEGGLVRTDELVIFAQDADWRLKLYATGPYWRAEGAD
ncbi:hypothetical protein [Aurantiacibacter spongiae]|uniref:Uncharacterized protein n=1 Tax=Aurantiacibacter spongiae TaxID=2488860 RepID=A0A3N5CRB0_9SPHN|nr:hypothetical protein [Aurantiacibacter spongiae]RPF71614.1 hypothetical protein EG799_08260 [Aurantiacibacter spongiae]